MSKSDAIRGMEIGNAARKEISCTGCIFRKAHRANIPKKSQSRANRLLELVHSDVDGPLEVPSLRGARYFVSFIDYFSKWTELYTMKVNSETFACFKLFHVYAEKHTAARIGSVNVIKGSTQTAEESKTLRTDNGGEYISHEFKSFFQQLFGNYCGHVDCQLQLELCLTISSRYVDRCRASTEQLDRNSIHPYIRATIMQTFVTDVSQSNGRFSISTVMQACITIVPRSNDSLNLEHADVFRPLCQVTADTAVDYT